MPFTGELIAIATVLCWTLSVQFFAAASKMVGSTPVNIIRLAMALLLFSATLLVRDGVLLPWNFPREAWLYLSLSGVVGFFIGDLFLFKALVELGPRLATLIHAMAAPAAAVIGWLLLGEVYLPKQWLGIGVTLAGVGVVVLERSPAVSPGSGKQVTRVSLAGVIYGLGAMLGQAGGFVLSKAGMKTATGYLDAFGATQIRALAAFACFVLFFTVTGRWGHLRRALANGRAMGMTVIGSCVGPFLGVSLSLLTLHYLTTGVASTILSLVPVCIIPFAIYLHNEHVSKRAMFGAVVAVFGIYLLVG